jgi:tetratricopeptide (TPR) repeat protein
MLYIKNMASNEYFLYESEIYTPNRSKPFVVDALLSDSFKKISRYSIKRPYQLNDKNVFPIIDNIYRKQDKTYFIVDIKNPTSIDTKANIYIVDKKTKTKRLLKTVNAKKNQVSNFFISINTQNNGFGYKTILTEIIDEKNNVIDTDKRTILYSALRNTFQKPLFISINFPEFNLPNMYYYTASQYFKYNILNKAEYFVNKSLNVNKSSQAVILKVKILFKNNRYGEGINYLKKHYPEMTDDNAKFLLLKGYFYSGKYSKAKEIGNLLLNLNFRKTEFLNIMGDIAVKESNKHDAILYYKNSLKLNNNQKNIREKLNAVSNTKK